MSSSESQLFRCLQSLELTVGSENFQSQRETCLNCYLENGRPLDARLWIQLIYDPVPVQSSTETLIYKLIYHCGVDHKIRNQVSFF